MPTPQPPRCVSSADVHWALSFHAVGLGLSCSLLVAQYVEKLDVSFGFQVSLEAQVVPCQYRALFAGCWACARALRVRPCERSNSLQK